ncbi:hypothetical protein [Kingella sp. (in: b-proteobacteria)]|uniref:hypothetical protein n=1 Tax=Kingella sp. (in: b-proteobacteria) TaxID=2020713 RepID=UPI0026DDBF78|nr:hypothetical protein [Kingella sp. (in: b-proteobacteria)]MDO4657665.1 hypothetical protein [Kingella sp. (in: b-proteobacteria)]
MVRAINEVGSLKPQCVGGSPTWFANQPSPFNPPFSTEPSPPMYHNSQNTTPPHRSTIRAFQAALIPPTRQPENYSAKLS